MNYTDYMLNWAWGNEAADASLAMLPLQAQWELSPWVVATLLVLFVGYCLSVALPKKAIAQDFSKFFSEKERASFSVTFSPYFIYARTFLFLLAMLCMGFLSFRLATILGYDATPPMMLFFAAIFLFFTLGSEGVMLLIGAIFFRQKQCWRFVKRYFSFVAYSAILLFPLCLCAVYAPMMFGRVCMWMGIAVVCLVSLALMFKLFQIFFEAKVAPVYLFLYLCAWKFLPILVLLKAIGEGSLIVEL